MAGILAGASNVTISGGTFSIHQGHSNSTGSTPSFDRLSQAAAHSALHDAPARTDETRCHQHTRINIINGLERWAQGICADGGSIFWLHGGAGAGKSAVMQTLAERFVAEGLALGSFFFSRSDPTRNTAEVLIPTLLYQVAQTLPAAMDVLTPVIDRDPLIFKKSLQVQSRDLLVPTLRHLVQLGHISDALQTPRVFLIDGLDECDDPLQQQGIIRAMANVCHDHRVPVHILIASRPEYAISTSFELYKGAHHELGSISLSEDVHAEADIRRFIKDEFVKIRAMHPFRQMIPPEWPAIYDINRLVWKSSSHFIYASTAMKYIWSAKESPVRSLQVVLGIEASRTIAPFAELDALYHHILRSSAYLEKVLQIIAHCAYSFLYSPTSPTSIVYFMLDCSEDDFCIYLADMTPLVVISKSKSLYGKEELNVRLLHASLDDFLRDQSRSGSFYVKKEVYLSSKLERCFRLADVGCEAYQMPDFPSSIWATAVLGLNLYAQIIDTIRTAGHIAVTQEVLGRYRLLRFFKWRLGLKGGAEKMHDVLLDFFVVFLAIHSIKTSESVTMFKSSAEDFLNILDTHVDLQETPLVAAIFRLIFSGYPAGGLWEALNSYLPRLHVNPYRKGSSHKSFATVYAAISATQLLSIQGDLNTSSERFLKISVVVILRSMLDGSGAETLWWKQDKWTSGLFDALLWALPKVGASETIQLYSRRTKIIRELYWPADRNITLRLADCLERYNIRIQNAKLQQLERRIENGDVNAVIEKSRILVIDGQD